MELKQKNNTAILLSSHILNNVIVERFNRISQVPGYDSFILLDFTNPSEELREKFKYFSESYPIITFNVSALKRKYKFFKFTPVILFGKTIYRKAMLVPGNNHLPVVDFLLNHNYVSAWNIEFDVIFSANWQRFFCAHEDSNADLLTSQVTYYHEDPDWFWWFFLKTGGRHSATWIRSFNPIYRLSKRGASALQAYSKQGWYGHHEAVMPSVIGAAGLILEDLGGQGKFVRSKNFGQWYTNTSFNFYGVNWENGEAYTRGLLLHPVKDLSRLEMENFNAGI